MSSRRTEISDLEIEDFDTDLNGDENIHEEIFSLFSDALLDELRLMKRFYSFCEEYNNFEFDEMGINMDESEDILRKIEKIRDLFLFNIENNISCIFIEIESDTFTRTITAKMQIKESQYDVSLEVTSDRFNLELS